MRSFHAFILIIVSLAVGVLVGRYVLSEKQTAQFIGAFATPPPEPVEEFNLNVTRSELESLLREAEDAYWEENNTIREFDEQWQNWYAEYILRKLEERKDTFNEKK